ncbi:MAG TPA: hypothetical protein VEU28_04455 [Actinomycetota bacterium]|nr:hypothetical protein [Actinomycetota bacterium]
MRALNLAGEDLRPDLYPALVNAFALVGRPDPDLYCVLRGTESSQMNGAGSFRLVRTRVPPPTDTLFGESMKESWSLESNPVPLVGCGSHMDRSGVVPLN